MSGLRFIDKKKLIIKSIKCCALNLAVDVSEDHQIHCFKKGQPCENAAEMFRSQQEMLSEPDVNPFLVYEEDSERMVMMMTKKWTFILTTF